MDKPELRIPPRLGGIYVIEGAYLDGILFKVGRSKNLQARMKDHFGSMTNGASQFGTEFVDWANVRWWVIHDPNEQKTIERRVLVALEDYSIEGYIPGKRGAWDAIGGDIFYTTTPIDWPTDNISDWALERLCGRI